MQLLAIIMALALLQISAPQAKTRAISNPEIIFPDEMIFMSFLSPN
jgi:hypothetical protein